MKVMKSYKSNLFSEVSNVELVELLRSVYKDGNFTGSNGKKKPLPDENNIPLVIILLNDVFIPVQMPVEAWNEVFNAGEDNEAYGF